MAFRLYHHKETCLAVHPKELDEDSEGESVPVWIRQKTVQMIDELSDVNEGEKELMKLWNLHVLKDGYVGDCQLPLACETFLRDKGLDIVNKNLYRNFILHMCSLFDYGLVSPEAVYKSVQQIQGLLSKDLKGQEMMSKQRDVQLKYWLEVGRHKQEEQKLKSPHKNHPSSNTLPGDGNSFLNSKKKENKDVNCTTSKRSANSVMRMHTKGDPSLITSNNLPISFPRKAVAIKTASNNLPISFPSKAVAKKTASQVDDQVLSKETNAENGLKRRLGTGNIKEELSIQVAEGNQAIKRKNLQKGMNEEKLSAYLATSAPGADVECSDDDTPGALALPSYLLSSDEDESLVRDDCVDQALGVDTAWLDKFMQGDKCVDEFDALTSNRKLKRPLPPHRDLSVAPSTSAEAEACETEIKKRKQEKKERSEKSREEVEEAKNRKHREKFRLDIACVIVENLKAYCKESCTIGRIKTHDDFCYLTRKLTQFVMVKESKYCEQIGRTLYVTESVKYKARQFIKEYLSKYGTYYERRQHDVEYKDIPGLKESTMKYFS